MAEGESAALKREGAFYQRRTLLRRRGIDIESRLERDLQSALPGSSPD